MRRVVSMLLLAGLLLGASVGYVWSEGDSDGDGEAKEVEPLEMLLPGPACVVKSDTLDLIGLLRKKDDGSVPSHGLTVDGQAREWEAVAPPVLHARLRLDDGKHVISVGDKKYELFVAKGDVEPPGEWPVMKAHPANKPSLKGCSACHETTKDDAGLTVGDWKDHNACFKCHGEDDFAETHAHTLEPLTSCGQCHAIHGATQEHLLRAPARQLCVECHD